MSQFKHTRSQHSLQEHSQHHQLVAKCPQGVQCHLVDHLLMFQMQISSQEKTKHLQTPTCLTELKNRTTNSQTLKACKMTTSTVTLCNSRTLASMRTLLIITTVLTSSQHQTILVAPHCRVLSRRAAHLNQSHNPSRSHIPVLTKTVSRLFSKN